MQSTYPIQKIDPDSEAYRKVFSAIKRPPREIFAQGNLELLRLVPDRGFAVVGTRAPQKRCLELTEKFIRALSNSRLVIVSGLARGIDQKAHEAALKAKLPTIAVLGCGIDQTYPPENDRLREEILRSGGLILSEWGPRTDSLPAFFIQRNRLIAGLSLATWVVQAGYRSGASNTAHWAGEMHRKVYVTPGFPGDPSLLGNQKLVTNQQATPLWQVDDLTQTWFDLIHHLDDSESISSLLTSIEKNLNEGLNLPEALIRCSQCLGIPLERVIEEYEKRA